MNKRFCERLTHKGTPILLFTQLKYFHITAALIRIKPQKKIPKPIVFVKSLKSLRGNNAALYCATNNFQ